MKMKAIFFSAKVTRRREIPTCILPPKKAWTSYYLLTMTRIPLPY